MAERGHEPVMVDEVLRFLGQATTVMDMTLGAGGHAEALLASGVERVIGLDRDPVAIELATGSMLTGAHRGQRVGACTDCRRFWAGFRGDEIDAQEIAAVNDQLVASVGTCSVMGTASTMAVIRCVCGSSCIAIILSGRRGSVYTPRRQWFQ